MLQIDGTYGEGGGQVLRSSLALSIITQTPFTITNIRGRRSRGGLGKQHLTSVLAAAEISGATVEGAHLHSKSLTFTPHRVQSGNYTFKIGSAGSTTLVLQTILPPLLQAMHPSTITIYGGTHNMKAPPSDFLEQSFFPILHKMGVAITCSTNRYGFYPIGGGQITVTIHPQKLQPLELLTPGKLVRSSARIISAHRPLSIIKRQSEVVKEILPNAIIETCDVTSAGPGGAVMISVQKEHITELFTGFSKRDIPADITAKVVAERAADYEESSYVADGHLTDQLLIPILLAGSGHFSCTEPSLHAITNAEIIRQFTGRVIHFTKESTGWHCSLTA